MYFCGVERYKQTQRQGPPWANQRDGPVHCVMITAGDKILVPTVALCYCTAGADISPATDCRAGAGARKYKYYIFTRGKNITHVFGNFIKETFKISLWL